MPEDMWKFGCKAYYTVNSFTVQYFCNGATTISFRIFIILISIHGKFSEWV
jgi:hypothetical protein